MAQWSVAAGEARPIMGPARGVVAPEEAAEVAREHPGLKTVLNHTGYPLDRSPGALAVWRRGMEALAACPNVWCKISGLTVRDEPWTLVANRPIILDAIRIFGIDRCMFASNFLSTVSRAAGTTSTASSSGRLQTSRSASATSCSPKMRRGSIASRSRFRALGLPDLGCHAGRRLPGALWDHHEPDGPTLGVTRSTQGFTSDPRSVPFEGLPGLLLGAT